VRSWFAAPALAAALSITGCGTASDSAARSPITIRMTDGLRFVPARATVRVGQRVAWKNVGGVAHTVTTLRSKASRKADASVPAGARAWDSGFIGGGETYTRTFTIPGIYRYFCIPHEGARMVGTIVVRR